MFSPLPLPAQKPLQSSRNYYSMSQLRLFFSGCSYRYHLKYELGMRERLRSAAFLGRLVHQMIQLAYQGAPLHEAHASVWQKACAPISTELANWYALDEAYQRSGRPHTKSRQHWSEEHPQHVELAKLIEEYREEFLSEEYAWGKTVQLTTYYRWSRQFAALAPTTLLLPYPRLVEGQQIQKHRSWRELLGTEDQNDAGRYTLLRGVLQPGIPVAGVPDLFTVDQDGVARVADYKVIPAAMMSPGKLAEDGQLALYVELLRQAGYLSAGQKTYVGHLYLTEHDGLVPVWTTLSRVALPRLTSQFAYMDRHIQAHDYLPARGIATGKQDACLSCGFAALCTAPVAAGLDEVEEGDPWE